MENTLKTKKSIKPWTWILFILTVPSLLYWAFTDSNVLGYIRYFSYKGLLSFLPHINRNTYFLASFWTGGMALLFIVAVFCAFMRRRIPVIVISAVNIILFTLPILLANILDGDIIDLFTGEILKGNILLLVSDLVYIVICLLIHVALILLCFVEKPALRIIAAIAFILLGILAIAGTLFLGTFRYDVINGLSFVGIRHYQRYLVDEKLYIIKKTLMYIRNGAPIQVITEYARHILCIAPLTACFRYLQSAHHFGSNIFPVSMGMFLVTAGTAFLGLPRLKKVKAAPTVAAEPQLTQEYTNNFQPEFAPVAELPVEEPPVQPVEEPAIQQPQETGLRDNLQNIALLKELLDSGAITQEEFDAKKAQLLNL